MRPSAQPVLWKIISTSKAEHLTSFWYGGPGEMAYKAVYPSSILATKGPLTVVDPLYLC